MADFINVSLKFYKSDQKMDIKNFAVIQGKEVVETDGVIKLNHIKKDKNEISEKQILNARDYANAEVRSDILFSSGEIELKFKFSTQASGVLFLFTNQNDENITVGLSYYNRQFVVKLDNRDKEPISKASKSSFYEIGKEYSLKVTVSGSNMKLFVNKILLCEATVSIKESPIALRMVTEKMLEVYDIKVKATKPKVFVIMQFTKEYNELYEEVIKPVVELRGFDSVRADEFYTSTPILKDIIDSIKQSNVVIAEITPDNPNVFYEIGYSHAIEKPTVLLCDRKREKLPFDLSSFRTLFYENTIAGKKIIEENLKKYLDNII